MIGRTQAVQGGQGERGKRAGIVRRALRGAAAIALMLAAPVAGVAQAQDRFPSRPIEFIVPWGPGGGSDLTARKIAKQLEGILKVSVPVVNAPGATGSAGITKLLAGQPDGYTLGLMAVDTYALLAWENQPKWKASDYTPLALMVKYDSGIFVNEKSRFATWGEFEKEARAKPKSLKIAVNGFGSPQEMAVNHLRTRGIDLTIVPYANPSERYAALLGGHVDALYDPVGNVKGYLGDKQMRPLLVLCSKRFPGFENVPCSKEVGLEVTLPQFRAVVVKAGTDPERMRVLSDALEQVGRSTEFRAFLREQFADEESFLPTKGALAFMEEQLGIMKRIVAASPAK